MLLLCANTSQAELAGPVITLKCSALNEALYRRVWVVFGTNYAFNGVAGPIHARVSAGATNISALAEFPLPWSDGRIAACISWAAADEPENADSVTLTLYPSRTNTVGSISPVNFWPDPYIDRPINPDVKKLRMDQWHFANWGQPSQGYRVWGEAREGGNMSICLETREGGNFNLIFPCNPNIRIEPGKNYCFSFRYLAKHKIDITPVILFKDKENRDLDHNKSVDSPRDDRVIFPADQWRLFALDFTVPDQAAFVMPYVKMTSAGILWLDDFALISRYPPMFRIKSLDNDYGLNASHARFKILSIKGREALVPVGEPGQAGGIEVWTLKVMRPEDTFNVQVSIGNGRYVKVKCSKDGLVEVPLFRKEQVSGIHFRFVGPDGRQLAKEVRYVNQRQTVLDF